VTLVFFCLGTAYTVIFDSQSSFPGINLVNSSPVNIVIFSVILGAVNSITTNLISDLIFKKIEGGNKNLKHGLIIGVFIVSLLGTLVIAFLSPK